MIPDAPNPAVGAAGSGKICSSLPRSNNTPDFKPPKRPFQAEIHVARRRRLVTHLHRLGPAPLAHFISDIERGADLDTTLEAYAVLPVEFVLAYGGDKFPEPMLAIRGGRR